MKPYFSALVFSVVSVLSAVPAGAVGWDGTMIEVSYSATGFGLLGQTYITAPGVAPFGSNFYAQIGAASFSIGSSTAGTFLDVSFNGFTLFDWNDTAPDIIAATLTTTGVTGTPVLTFDADTVYLNMAGTDIEDGYFATVELYFVGGPLPPAPPPVVPVPAGLPLLAGGIGLLELLRRRRKTD